MSSRRPTGRRCWARRTEGVAVRLGGPSCLAGDIIGDYVFATPPTAGTRIAFLDQAHYSMVKTNTFNGVPLPAIALWNSRHRRPAPRSRFRLDGVPRPTVLRDRPQDIAPPVGYVRRPMSILHPKARKAAIAFIFVTAVLDILSMGVIMPVLPSLIEEFAGSNASAGIWNGAFVAMWAAMQFLASPVIGSLSDRYGRRPVILISCAGLALDWMLMALAPNLWWLAVGRILGGLTSSSFTAIYAYMADITAPENRARAYGLIGAAFSGGFVLGPVVGGFLGEIGPRAAVLVRRRPVRRGLPLRPVRPAREPAGREADGLQLAARQPDRRA